MKWITILLLLFLLLLLICSSCCSILPLFLLDNRELSQNLRKYQHFHEKCALEIKAGKKCSTYIKPQNIHWGVVGVLAYPRGSAKYVAMKRACSHTSLFFSTVAKTFLCPQVTFLGGIMERNKSFHMMKILILKSSVWKVILQGGF